MGCRLRYFEATTFNKDLNMYHIEEKEE